MRILFTLLCFVTGPALAQSPMSGPEFEAYTQGNSILYSDDNGPFGQERYLRERRVRWSDLDGNCLEGKWYATGPEICFVYEGVPGPACWQFFRKTNGLRAEYTSDDTGFVLFEHSISTRPLNCPGPRVGV